MSVSKSVNTSATAIDSLLSDMAKTSASSITLVSKNHKDNGKRVNKNKLVVGHSGREVNVSQVTCSDTYVDKFFRSQAEAT